jgi:uncharacterized membrane protein YecN with MAPEG domain
MPTIVPFYASLLAGLYIVLAVRVIRMRRKERIAIGDRGNARLQRAMRVHANFAEYVPLALILLTFVEWQGSSPLFVHGLGLALLVGRVVHAYGVSQEKENYRLRTVGMLLTLGAILGAAVRLIGAFVFGLP